MIRTERVGKRGLLVVFDNLGDLGTNSYLIAGRTATYIIDTGFGSGHGERLLSLADASKPVIVINTHHHWDHVGGNCVFRGGLIVSHRLCRESLDTGWEAAWKKNMNYASGSVEKCLPSLVFDGELAFPEDGITLFRSPGHTADGIAVYDGEDRVLMAGDNVGDTVGCPVPDLTEPTAVYRESVLAYKALDFEVLVSGHNRVLDRSFLDTVLDRLSR